MTTKVLIAIGVTIACSISMLRVEQAVAQETEISVSPAIVDAPVEIGASIKKTIQVTNGSESPLPISVEAQAVVIEGESIAEDTQKRFDVSDWISFREKAYVFTPGESKKIEFTITAPFTALPGGHYAQISLRGLTLESTTEDQSSSLIFPEVGVPVLITVPGEIIENASIIEKNIFPTLISRNKKIEGSVPVQNTGTVHNLVKASIVVIKDDEEVLRQPLQPNVILPGTQRKFEYEWALNEYGKYDAFIELTYGSKIKVISTQSESVYVIPPFSNLGLLAISVWTTLYVYPRRANVISALEVLIK